MKTSIGSGRFVEILGCALGVAVTVLGATSAQADGLDTWHRRNAGGYTYISALTFNPAGVFVVVDQNGPYDFSGNPSSLLTSKTGETWERRQTGTNDLLTDRIAAAGGQLRAVRWSQYPVSVGQLVRSTDGVNWTEEDPLGEGMSVKSVEYVNGQWLAVAGPPGPSIIIIECGDPFGPPCPEDVLRLYFSANGTAWRGVDLSVPQYLSGGGNAKLDVISADFAYGNGAWVVLACVSRVEVFNPSSQNEVFLFAWRSTDGTNFVRSAPLAVLRTSNLQNAFEPFPCSVAHGNGRFVAVARTGSIYSSADGLAWTTNSVTPSATLRDVAFGAGQFVAVGSKSGPVLGAIVTSGDGLNWRHRDSSLGEFLRQVEYGAHRFVVIGGTNRVLQSDTVISLGLSRGPEPQFTLSVPTLSSCRIEFTSDLNSPDPWQVWTNIVVPTDPLVFPAPPLTEPRRFFRAVLEQ